MNFIQVLYASGGPEIIYEALEIDDGVNVIRVVKAFQPMMLGGKLFEPAGIDIAKPKRDASGIQDVTFVIDNVNGEPNKLIREMLANNRRAKVTLYNFTSNDLDTPSIEPITLFAKGGTINSLAAQITAGYYDMTNTAWPRRVYDSVSFPALKYIG